MQRLELRPWPYVALAFLTGPVIGLTLCLAADTFPSWLQPWNAPPNDPLTWWLVTVSLGTPICLVVEIVVVTPIMIAWKRHRWSWVNGWSAAAVGFLLGGLPWLLLGASQPSPSPDQIPGSVTVCTGGHCTTQSWTQAGLGAPTGLGHSPEVWELHGQWTLAGWGHVAHDAALVGLVGLAAAVVLRLVAVRAVASPDVAGRSTVG
jgi:hypothetical protein